MNIPSSLDKSKGFAFTYKPQWLKLPIHFYHGLYSHNSYAGEYRNEIVYVSGVGCILMGREEAVRMAVYYHLREKGELPL